MHLRTDYLTMHLRTDYLTMHLRTDYLTMHLRILMGGFTQSALNN